MTVCSLQSLTVVTPLSDVDTFSGRGYLLIPSSIAGTVTFTAEVPITGKYFVILRYKVIIFGDSIDTNNYLFFSP